MKLIAGSIILTLLVVMGFNAAWGKAKVSRGQYGILSIKADTEEELFDHLSFMSGISPPAPPFCL